MSVALAHSDQPISPQTGEIFQSLSQRFAPAGLLLSRDGKILHVTDQLHHLLLESVNLNADYIGGLQDDLLTAVLRGGLDELHHDGQPHACCVFWTSKNPAKRFQIHFEFLALTSRHEDAIFVQFKGTSTRPDQQCFGEEQPPYDLATEIVDESTRLENFLKLLIEKTTGSTLPYNEMIEQLVSVGSNFLRMPNGLIVTRTEGGFRVERIFGPSHSIVKKGMPLDKKNSLTSIILEKLKVIEITENSGSEYRSNSVFQATQFGSFIGTPIYQDGESVGALVFLNTETRSRFSYQEREGLQLLASWIGQILEKKKQLQRIEHAGRELELFFDLVPVRMVHKDANNRILRLNKSAAKTIGMRRKECIGQSMDKLMPAKAQKLFQDDLEVIRTGRPKRGILEQYKNEYGDIGWLSKDKIPYTDPETGQPQVVAVATDVTELIALRDDYESQRAHYRKIYQATPSMMFEIDQDGRIVEISDTFCDALGYARHELEHEKLIDFMIVDHHDTLIEPALCDLLLGEPLISLPVTFKCRNGDLMDAEWSAIQTPDHGDMNFVRTLSVVVDVTDRNKARDALELQNIELERANEGLQQFASVASHDLQEPLLKIRQFSQLLETDLADRLTEEESYYLQVLVNSSKRMSNLISALLSYSRTTHGSLSLYSVDLTNVIREIRDEFWSNVLESGAAIRIEDLPEVNADLIQTLQLFRNLISNALKYQDSEKPAIVEVTSRTTETAQVISVRDNGIGFEMSHAEAIMQPFNRLHTKEEYPGSGIGLAICNKVCERHGWSLQVESVLGEGSRFDIIIPHSIAGSGQIARD